MSGKASSIFGLAGGPLPAYIERNMGAQLLLPGHRQQHIHLKRSLSQFRSSGAAFTVVDSIPAKGATGRHGNPSASRPRNLIVLDSSFNPPTLSHLRIATSALSGVPADSPSRLVLLLSVHNADKAERPAAFDQRLGMMVAFGRDLRNSLKTAGEASEEGGGLRIDIALTTRPYFHGKSAAIADWEEYAEEDNTGEPLQQVFLVGYDTLIRIFNSKYYSSSDVPASDEQTPMRTALDPFFKSARLRVTLRTDDEWGGRDEQEAYVDGLQDGGTLEKAGGRKEWASKVELVEGRKETDAPISSTRAREAARRKDWENLGRMVSPEVSKWIQLEELYAGDG